MTGVGLAVSALISGDEKKLKYVGRSYVAEGSGWIHRRDGPTRGHRGVGWPTPTQNIEKVPQMWDFFVGH